MNLQNRKRLTDLENKLVVAKGKDGGEGIREFGMDLYTQVYLKGMTNKDLLYSTRNSVQCYVAACVRGEFRGEWMCAHLWLCPFVVRLKLLQHW